MLSKFSVKRPFTVVISVILVLILGIVSFTGMTTDLLPSIDLPYVLVMTSYPGASPEEVETAVSKPIEQSMATISNVENVSSVSSENVSMVIMEFNDDANMDSVSIDIRENLDMVSSYFTESVGSPTIMKINPDMMPVMVAAIDAKGLKNTEVSQLAKDTIVPKIESIDGVASVNVGGLIEEQVNVIINQEKIDMVNQKLANSVDDKFKEAEEKITQAKDELDKGKTELTDKSNEFNNGMVKADQGITDGKLEILKKEMELEKGEKELDTQQKAILKNEKELEKKEKELNSGLKEIKKQEKQMQIAEEKLKTTEKDLLEKKKTVDSTRKQLELLEQNSEVKAKLKEVISNQKKIQEGITKIDKQKKEMYAAKNKLKETKATMNKGTTELKGAKTKLETGKKQIETAITKMQTGKTALNAGKESIKQKETELATKKEEVSYELNNAKDKIYEGEKELNDKTGGMDSQKEDALKSTDVSTTITNEMVSNILKAQNFSMPAGYVTEEGIDYLVRVGDKIEDVKELSNLILFDPGVKGIEPIKLSDVADVFKKNNSDETYAKVNGNDAVVVSIQKQNSYSTSDVSKKIAKKFDTLMKEDKTLNVTYLMDQGMYIDVVVDSVLNNLIMGGILAIIILLLFLRDLKPTLIISCSIPISVIFAIVLMYFSGVTLNIISLSGLAVGVGMLVDNSVVVIENIYRLRNKGVSTIKAAVSGSVQVAGAITASTLTTICVFLPIVFVKGITRKLFTDMALTIGYSLLASLVIALTLVPMMSSRMLKNTKEKNHKLFDKMLDGYEFILRKALKLKPIVIIASILILILSAYGTMKKGTSFMPETDSSQISVTLNMKEGSVLEDITKMSDAVMERILKIKDVETTGAMLGSGDMMGMGKSNNKSISMYVVLKDDKKKDSNTIAKEIKDKCKDLDCEIITSGSSMDMSALGGSGISINVKGHDIDKIRKTASGLASELKKVKGTTDISDGMEELDEELRIVIDKEKAMKQGITVAQAYQELQKELKTSLDATKLEEASKEYPVVVKNKKNEDLVRADIKDYIFKIKDKDGKEKEVPLRDIANMTDTQTLASINRKSGSRYVTVTSGVKEGYNIGIVSKEVEEQLKNYKVEEGCELEITGENETITEALGQLVLMILLGVIFIYLIMVAQFQSLLSPFIVMFTIPLAFTGGFLGLLITNNELSVISMIGFVMLCGIIVNNGIVLVDYINQLRREGIDKKTAIIEAGRTRMRPILMTALTTVLGLSTMALGIGMGADMMQPIAIVTIGGLLYATVMTLFVVPVLYDLFNRKDIKVIDESELEITDL